MRAKRSAAILGAHPRWTNSRRASFGVNATWGRVEITIRPSGSNCKSAMPHVIRDTGLAEYRVTKIHPKRGILSQKEISMARTVLLLLIATAGLGMAESAEEMLSACRPLTTAKVQADAVEFAHTFDTGTCWGGAFGALQSVSRAASANNKPMLPIGCAPVASTRTQWIAIFVEFAQKNPQRFNEEFSFVAMAAMRAAFPCPTR